VPRDLTEYDRLPSPPRRGHAPRRLQHGQRSDPPRPKQPDRGRSDDDPVVARLRRHLESLGLTRTRDERDELLAWSARERPGATALLEHIVGLEAAHKLEQRITRRIDTSGLVERKSLEAFDWDFQPSLDKSLVLELARLDFVRRHDDLVITGNNGTGKSHLLKAFALRACEQGLHMRYARCVDLLEDLHAGLADGNLRPSPQGLGASCALDH
jgi:DNA replication protein DnaC